MFTRTFTVPSTVDAEKVAAELEAGVLKVHLPKSEAAKPRRSFGFGGTNASQVLSKEPRQS